MQNRNGPIVKSTINIQKTPSLSTDRANNITPPLFTFFLYKSREKTGNLRDSITGGQNVSITPTSGSRKFTYWRNTRQVRPFGGGHGPAAGGRRPPDPQRLPPEATGLKARVS